MTRSNNPTLATIVERVRNTHSGWHNATILAWNSDYVVVQLAGKTYSAFHDDDRCMFFQYIRPHNVDKIIFRFFALGGEIAHNP